MAARRSAISGVIREKLADFKSPFPYLLRGFAARLPIRRLRRTMLMHFRRNRYWRLGWTLTDTLGSFPSDHCYSYLQILVPHGLMPFAAILFHLLSKRNPLCLNTCQGCQILTGHLQCIVFSGFCSLGAFVVFELQLSSLAAAGKCLSPPEEFHNLHIESQITKALFIVKMRLANQINK